MTTANKSREEKFFVSLFEETSRLGGNKVSKNYLKHVEKTMDDFILENFINRKEVNAVLNVEEINQMLSQAFEENGTKFFQALARIQATTNGMRLAVGVDSYFKCPEFMQMATLYRFWFDDLMTLEPEDDESCHLIAYTLKAIEVEPSDHFKNCGKVEIKKSITHMFQLIEKDLRKHLLKTKNGEHLETLFKAKLASAIWRKILKLHDEIYDDNFDVIW